MDRKHFFLGIIIGVACSAAVNFVLLHPPRPPMPPPGWMFREDDFIRHFSRQFKLTAGQRDKATPFIAAFHREIVAARVAQLDVTARAMDTLSQSVSTFFTEQQLRQLAQMRSQLERFRNEKPGEGLPPPPRLPPPPPY